MLILFAVNVTTALAVTIVSATKLPKRADVFFVAYAKGSFFNSSKSLIKIGIIFSLIIFSLIIFSGSVRNSEIPFFIFNKNNPNAANVTMLPNFKIVE